MSAKVVITKRVLSQLYGRGAGGIKELAEEKLMRKITLCKDLLETVSRIDPGFSQFRGLTTWELFLAKKEQCRRSGKESCENEELRDLLLIVILCLQMETLHTTPWKVNQLARHELLQMKGAEENVNNENHRLYSQIMEPVKRENPLVFFDISADGEKLGRIIMQLRADVVPR